MIRRAPSFVAGIVRSDMATRTHRRTVTRFASASAAFALAMVARTAWADGLPQIPFIYCEPCTMSDATCGEDDPSEFCLRAIISNLYAPPEGGWQISHAGQFNIQSAYFPSAPIDPESPFPKSYPHVVFSFTPGANQPNERVEWDDPITAYGRFPNHQTTVQLKAVHPCTEDDRTCVYEVLPLNGTAGDPPDWFAGYIGTNIPGSVWASYALIVGLIADGNNAPEGELSLLGADQSVLASVSTRDADGDGIVNYVFDWGDGQQTNTPLPTAEHEYAAAGRHQVKVWFVDRRGAVGSAVADTGMVLTTSAAGAHVVQVGQQIHVTVQLRNQGLDTVVVGHNYGYTGGSPPSGTVQMVSNPGFATNIVLAPGQSVTGNYVFNALKSGTFNFAFGGGGRPQACPQCEKKSVYATYPVTIQDEAAPPPPADEIFTDDFEDGDFDAWTNAATDGGDLSVAADAAMVGTKGVRAVIDDRRRLVLTDASPEAESSYRLGFRFDPGDYSTPDAAPTSVLLLISDAAPPPRRVLRVRIRRSGGALQMMARVRLDDGSVAVSPWVDIVDGPQAVELAWAAATVDGQSDGYLTVSVDGMPAIHLMNLDNDETSIDKARIGVLDVPAGAAGTLAFDEFDSRRTGIAAP